MQLVIAAGTPSKLLHGRHQEDIAALTQDSLLALLDTTFRHDIETFKVGAPSTSACVCKKNGYGNASASSSPVTSDQLAPCQALQSIKTVDSIHVRQHLLLLSGPALPYCLHLPCSTLTSPSAQPKPSSSHLLHLDSCRITLQAVLLWADADPAIRAPHTPQLYDHIPAPNLYIMLENIRQLPCMPEVEEALHRWVKHKKHDLGATASGNSCCSLDDFTRHQQPSRGQLLIAGGHDVTWQSLRLTFTSCSQLYCGLSQADLVYTKPHYQSLLLNVLFICDICCNASSTSASCKQTVVQTQWCSHAGNDEVWYLPVH